jgi:outer membrane protein assembly factor BamD
MVNDQLAGKEMTIGRWYLRQNDILAAIGRFRTVVDRYQTTSHTPEALYRLVEAYLTLGLIDEAKKDGAVLGYNYPGDAWYVDAYALLTSKGLRPAVEPVPTAKRGLFHTPFNNKNKATTVTPPAAGFAPKVTPASTDDAPAKADDSAATPAATTPTPAADATAPAQADAPKKKRSFFHIPFTGGGEDKS